MQLAKVYQAIKERNAMMRQYAALQRAQRIPGYFVPEPQKQILVTVAREYKLEERVRHLRPEHIQWLG